MRSLFGFVAGMALVNVTVGCNSQGTESGAAAKAVVPSPNDQITEVKSFIQQYIDRTLGGDQLSHALLLQGNIDKLLGQIDVLEITSVVPAFQLNGKPIPETYRLMIKVNGYELTDLSRNRLYEKSFPLDVQCKDGKCSIVRTSRP